ncbi:c-type cytochrome [Pelagibius sp. CAU 1746]|uniref:c-type cytochrome n=1 Tax=Pelagibius sp. CAU 1746 TaxID=3140370 RepID=UPI00325A5FA1
MSKFLRVATAATLALLIPLASASAEGDAAKGEKVFKKCKACHAVGEGAKNKVGPHLNDVVGRSAGTVEGFKYSAAMVAAGEGGVVWDEDSLSAYLEKPRDYIKGNRMSFAGLRKEDERADVIAYLETFSEGSKPAAAAEPADAPSQQAAAASAPAGASMPAADTPQPTHGVFHLGREATAAEIAAWDIDIRPDGTGLPAGRGSVAEGEEVFAEVCAVCHGDFGEGRDRWPVLAGGQDTLTAERPVKTIGSYWPYLSTVYDYVRRAMPFGDARSLSDGEVYAITAYLLYLNDVVTDDEFVLSNENFSEIRLPNEDNFFMDDRGEEAHYLKKGEPCMTDCKPDPVEITMRARVLDVTPDAADDEQGVGAVD